MFKMKIFANIVTGFKMSNIFAKAFNILKIPNRQLIYKKSSLLTRKPS